MPQEIHVWSILCTICVVIPVCTLAKYVAFASCQVTNVHVNVYIEMYALHSNILLVHFAS